MPDSHSLQTWDTHWDATDTKDASIDPYSHSEWKNDVGETASPATVSSTTVMDIPKDLPPRTNVRRPKSWLQPWTLEIVASAISLVTLMGLIILLSQFDGREYRHWAWKFTLNGVVAIIATICHTALMVPIGAAISQSAWLYYLPTSSQEAKSKGLEHIQTFDDASRSAIGSLKLLWQIRGQNLAAIGAVLTILALAFSTLTQQVVSLEDRSIVGGDPEIYSAGEVPHSFYENGYDHGSTLSNYIPTLDARAAIYNGILSQDIQPPTVFCSTGNCTWPIVPSLAVCGECSPSTFTTSCNATFCNYTMPTGTIFTSPITPRFENPLFQVNTLDFGGSKYNMSSKEVAFVGVFDAIGLPWAEIFGNQSTIKATECGLWVCVEAYNTSSVNGKQMHSTVGNFSTLAPSNAGSSSSSSSSSVTGNRTFAAIPSSLNPLPNQNFSINGLSIVALHDGLSALTGTISGGVGTKSYSTNFIQSVWNNTSGGDLDPWVKRLALSMTNYLRSHSLASSTEANRTHYAGTVYHTQLYFRIRWAWLSLPIFLVLASLSFFIYSIIRSAQSGVEVFKGNPLAMLFSELDGSIKDKLATTGAPQTSGGLGGLARKTRVVLRTEEGKWLFKEA